MKQTGWRNTPSQRDRDTHRERVNNVSLKSHDDAYYFATTIRQPKDSPVAARRNEIANKVSLAWLKLLSLHRV